MQKRLIFFPIFFLLYEFMGNLSNDMYLPAFLDIARDFSTSHHQVQLSIASWFAGTCIAQLILGPLCDRFGRRPLIIIGGLIFLLSTLACALAPTISLPILYRFFQGFGVGSIMITGYASIHALYTDAHKATLILAWASTVAVTSPMIGPILGGFILLRWEWQTSFWILCVAALVPYLGVSFILPESLRPEERHSLHPVALGRTYYKLCTLRPFITRSLVFGLLCSGIILWVTASPYIIMKAYGYSPQAFGFLQAFAPAGFILGAQSVRFYLRTLLRERLITLGMGISLLGALGMVLSALFLSHSLCPLLGGILVYTYGFGAIAAPLQKEAIMAATSGKGMATSFFFLTMGGLNALVSFLIAALPDSSLIASSILLTIAIFTIVILKPFTRFC